MGMCEKPTIALDDETTWPHTVLEVLGASVCESAAAQTEVAAEIHALVEDREIIGYHCTRLADDEITCVKAEGLCPLTADLRRLRVQRRVEAGDLSPDMAVRLLNSGITGDGRHRLGCSCFYFTKEVGEWCWKFFRYWGGESIYVPHMNSNSEEKNRLISIGTPCIIEIAVPVSAIPYHSVARGFLFEYGRRRNFRYQETSHDVALAPMRVLRVVQYGSPEFASRTRDISWHAPIYP
jgi:hypothetical protein